MEKRVEGIYERVEDALSAVNTLKDKGYSRDQITLIANEEMRGSLCPDLDTNVQTESGDMTRTEGMEHDDRSWWDSIKDAFTMDDSYDDANYDDPDYDMDNDPIYPYRDSIRKGQIAVVVTGDPTGTDMDTDTDILDRTSDVNPTDPNMDDTVPGAMSDVDREMDMGRELDRDPDRTRDHDVDETIELREEHLEVDKEKTGEVHISKKVVEDTETEEIPGTKEERKIERKSPSGKTKDKENDVTDEEEIVVPVEEEKVRQKKETEVTEEVVVKKETKEDTETVGDTVRHEELEVEEEGKALDHDDDTVDRPKDDTLDREISNDRFDDDDRPTRR